jgi:uncharacterized DUF497 family protein
MFEIDGQIFDWDKTKNLNNIAKHGIPVKLAATVFSDTEAIYLDDNKHSYGEDRFIVIGLCRNLNLLTVCHCYKDEDTIRIISARKANAIEIKTYGGIL